MCGLIGAYWQSPSFEAEDRLKRGLDVINHRGPDDQGLEIINIANGLLLLAHRRLSIIDLSEGGHQPMQSPDGRYSIIFNGEIYNYRELRIELKNIGHRFNTSSDTEVLLNAWIEWGKSCLEKLIGMFSFVVFDRTTQELTCVRDAFGIKPLYYYLDEGSFCFASEVPALLELFDSRPALNMQASYDYLVFGNYDKDSSTFYKGIEQLKPGYLLSVNLLSDSLSPRFDRWWSPSVEQTSTLSFLDAADKLRDMFLSNVRLHLRSDVPVGIALSGGIDSSAIACAVRHMEHDIPIHTFSYVARESQKNEESWADYINDFTGALSHKVDLSSFDLARDLDEMILAQGEPFRTTSIFAQFCVYKLAHENGVKVTLDGQGADELLAGYNGYSGARMHSLIEHRQFSRLLGFARNWGRWPGRNYLSGWVDLGSRLIPDNARNIGWRLVGINPEPDWLDVGRLKDEGVKTTNPGMENKEDEYQRRLTANLRYVIANRLPALLRHSDRNSMRWSVESRVPFLTVPMAEFLLSLPEEYLLSYTGETKSIFRAAMRGIVPDKVLDRRDKIGFRTPERHWLKMLEPKVFKWLEYANNLSFINYGCAVREVKQVLDGEKPFSYHAWRLINYCRWAQLHHATC
jgi:asparagine synthase (glutamine-hydrolysing)